MKTKEKPLGKPKITNSKFPLPKIKYSIHKNPNAPRIKSGTRPLPNFHSNNHNLEQFNIIQQNKKPKETQKEEQKYNYKTNLKIKNIYEQRNINKNNIKNNEIKTNQNNLKHILKEFGLSEYLRKLYEFGYDNNNYLKIGTLSRKNFNNLLNNIHIFPGHTVKMEKFYEYLKKMNNNTGNYCYKRRKLNYNSIYGLNNGNRNNIYSNYNYNYENNSNKQSLNIRDKNKKCLSPRGRPKTSHVKGLSNPKIRIRNNYSGNKLMKRKILNNSEEDSNILIKSYLNDNRKFILNHKMNNIQNLYNFNNVRDKEKEEYNDLYNSCYNYNNSNNKELEDKINQNIERMLNYYMVQLNDKLDNSYETVEDSSLSYIVTSQINENLNKNNANKKENKVLIDYKLPSINNSKNKVDKKNENIKKENILNDTIIKSKKKEKDIDEKETKNKSLKNSEEIKLKEEKKELIEEEVKKETNKLKEEYKKDLKRISDHEVSTKSKDSKEHEIEEDEILLLREKRPLNSPVNLKDNNNSNSNNNNNNKINSKNKKDSLLDDSYLLKEKYSLEQNVYETLRLNKSMDAENINKDTLKFDIEFMCRCLALALMKHIEQGKEKMHLTELYLASNSPNCTGEQKLNFSFFNESFNQNINLLTEFFSTKNNKDANLGDMNVKSILEKFCLENGDIGNDDIDMVKHIKKKGDEKIIEKDNKQFLNGLYGMENEMRFIGELFSYQKKKSKNYQNLSENTKKILCKDLSYIKEIDSEMNKTNNSKSVISKSNNNSKVNKIENDEQDNDNMSKEDSKNNNENKTKIIDEEGKDDDEEYNFNEDDFINEININDNINEKKNNENKDNIYNEKESNENKGNNKENVDKEDQKKDTDLKDKNSSVNNNEKTEEESKNNENLIKKENEQKEINSININENLNINSLIKNEEKKEEQKDDTESSYIIDAENIIKFKEYLLKQFEIFDDDYLYYTMNIPARRFMPPPDPQTIFEFCANIMILTKMEKEVIILSLIYIERLIFNTGFIINSRNWRRIIFISLIIASKIWDDDSLENIHYSQVFTHLKIGEINLIERTFLELINYKVFVKFSEYIKYYFAIKNLALKYNFNGEKIVPVSVEKMMKIQEYAYQMQKRMRRKLSLNNSAHF